MKLSLFYLHDLNKIWCSFFCYQIKEKSEHFYKILNSTRYRKLYINYSIYKSSVSCSEWKQSICCIAVIHIQQYTHTFGNIIKNNERTHFFRKMYLSHFIRNGFERVAKRLCVRDELETEQTTHILTPSFFFFSSTSFSFCWPAQSGVLRAHSPLLGAGSLYSILSPTRLTPTNWTSPWYRIIYLFDDHLLLVGVTSAANSTRPQ